MLVLLQMPADDPRDTQQPPTATNTPAAAAAAGPSTTSVMAVVRRLDQQAKLYRYEGQRAVGGTASSTNI